MLHHSFEIVIFFSCWFRFPNLDHLLGARNQQSNILYNFVSSCCNLVASFSQVKKMFFFVFFAVYSRSIFVILQITYWLQNLQ